MSQNCWSYMINKIYIHIFGRIRNLLSPTVITNWIKLASKKKSKIGHFHLISSTNLQFHRFSSHFMLDGGWEMRGCHACDISVLGEGLEASAQGLLTACFHGLGPIIGLLGGGVLFDTLGGHTHPTWSLRWG